MKKIAAAFCIVMLLSLGLLVNAGIVSAYQEGYEVNGWVGRTTPAMDGQWTTDTEWEDTEETQMDGDLNVIFRMKSNSTGWPNWVNQYYLIEFFDDTTEDAEDYLQICYEAPVEMFGTPIGGTTPQTDCLRIDFVGHSQSGLTVYKGDGSAWVESTDYAWPDHIEIVNSISASPSDSNPHLIIEIKVEHQHFEIGTPQWIRLAVYDESNSDAGVQAWPESSVNSPDEWGFVDVKLYDTLPEDTNPEEQDYEESEGTLDGANYVVSIPDDWNGMLVVTCRGLEVTPSENPRTHVYNVSQSLWLDEGYAIAGSTYGAGGFCVAEGMSATYQLTMHLIDTYSITGKVFLVGTSLGGIIMLLLAEKYPDVYSGVLSITGGIDPKTMYEYGTALQNMTIDEIREHFNAPESVPDSELAYAKGVWGFTGPVIADYFGGTPEEQPEAYEELSPLHHANISVPVIYLAGEMDYVTPVFMADQYQDAVDAAGGSSYLQVYVVANGTHGQVGQFDEFMSAEIPIRFAELVIIPEGLTFAVMVVFLSSISLLIGSQHYLRKRSKKEIK